MVSLALLVGITAALVVLTSLVGRARRPGSSVAHSSTTTQQDTHDVADSLHGAHAQDELLRLKREALEATGVSSSRTAELLHEIDGDIERTLHITTIVHGDRGSEGGSAWN